MKLKLVNRVKDVLVNLHSSIAQNELKEEITYRANGKLDHDNRYYVLVYDELNSEDNSITKVIIKYNQEEVIIFKEGNIVQELNFFKAKQSYGSYEISGFNIKLNIQMLEFEVLKDHLCLVYELFVESHPSGLFKIDIKLGELRNE